MNRIEKPDTLPEYVIADIAKQVRAALQEDVGSGDITAQLIDAEARATATLISREAAVLCGRPWVEEVFAQLGGDVALHWHATDGDAIEANATLCTLSGNTRQLLTSERSALNFLQTLSAVATRTRQYVQAIQGKQITLLDTRKTLPGLRTAQKYAVLCGGGQNHRLGLYDAFLIKENHIAACGSIAEAVRRARLLAPDRSIIVEVENTEELGEAIAAKPNQIMLDEFATIPEDLILRGHADGIRFELSGNMNLGKLADCDLPIPVYISIGAITKHLTAIDLSLRII